jgi:hypothetical protein
MPKPINETLVDARWPQSRVARQRGIQPAVLLHSSQAIGPLLPREPFSPYFPRKGNFHGARMEADATPVVLIRLAQAAPDGMPGAIDTR